MKDDCFKEKNIVTKTEDKPPSKLDSVENKMTDVTKNVGHVNKICKWKL